VDAARSRVSSTSSSSSSSSSNSSSVVSTPSGTNSGHASDRDWVLLDLAYNALEGGAALCAAALIAATAEAAAAASSSTGLSGASASGISLSSAWGQTGTAGSVTDRQQQPSAQKQLILDGNPLGASGVRILMRAIAAQPAIGMGPCPGPPAADSASALNSVAAGSAEAQRRQRGSSDGDHFFLQAWGQEEAAGLQAHLPPQLPLHVSVAKVSLLAKEKGFRASLRAAEAAQAFAAQVSNDWDCFLGMSTL
jgi:hypothetical protein